MLYAPDIKLQTMGEKEDENAYDTLDGAKTTDVDQEVSLIM